MAEMAAGMRATLLALPGVAPVDHDAAFASEGALTWRNTLLTAPDIRRAHIEELYVAGGLAVLHVCLYAHFDDARPVFGFDMIAGPARITGIFLDLSPVLDTRPAPSMRDIGDGGGFAAPRVLPAWGAIFSDDVIAVRPTSEDEVARAMGMARAAFARWLETPPQSADVARVRAGQARYNAGQRENVHTLRALANLIGEDRARRFVETVLFEDLGVALV